MNIDERIEALTMNVELISRDVETLRGTAQKQGENIDRVVGLIENLARIAENHERRLNNLENQ
jgi:archaellum component FlaC